jgi:predicted permease
VNNNRVLVARLPEGSTIEAVAQRLPAAVERMRERFPDAVSDEHAVSLVPLRRHLYGSARGSLFILLGAVSLVQLIACANLANLLLVRAEERRTELAVRAALGAGRIRLVRGVLTESLALSLLGAAAGLLVAMLMLEAVRPLAPANVPMPDGIARDGSVLLLTLLAAIATGLGFGLIPAWTAARKDLRDTLVEGARSGTSRRRARARGTLVVAEVALTAILLVGAGLMLNTLRRLQSVDPGFGTEDRTAADIDLDAGRYPDPTDLNLFHRGLIEQIEASSGVEAAGLAQFLPLRDASNWGLEVEDRMDAGVVVADYNLVTPGYLDAMGMRVVSGRDITWDDAEPDAAPVLMVSEAMADRLWPGEDPIGRRINIDLASRVWREVVGVVSDVRNRSLAQPPGDLLYFPPVDLPMADPRGMSVVVHHPGDATAAADIRRIVTALDAAVPLTQLRDLSEIARASEARRLFVLVLLAMFAGLALVLAAVGLYGVVSYTFALRTREIGLRMAVGAGRGSVLGMVARQSAALVGSGLVVGLVGSAALARLLGSLLYEVGTTDATTYAAVIVFLGLVGGAATWIPARRATSVDPATILRS